MDKDEKNRLQTGWIESAVEDLETANDLHTLKRNHYSLFFCQLALEKLLKGLFIKNKDTHPPKTHDLTKLVRLINPDINTEILEQLAEITTFNIEARYDVYKEKLYKKADEIFTKKYLAITRELFNHLKKRMGIDFILDKNVIIEVKNFISLMKEHKIVVKSVILFGSYAKNKEHEDSDIDLAIVSDKFEEDEIEEMMTLKKLSIKVSNRIEPIPLRESYLESKYDTFIGEIKQYGKVLYSA